MAVVEPNVTRELQDIRNDLISLRKDLSELAQAVRVNLKDETQHLREGARHALDAARERGDKAIHTMEHRIEERPFFSVVTAFIVGLLAGGITERRMLMGRQGGRNS
ncbi:DUF883 family protein [Calidithermus chliarophilus]|uniref:DUF883 family protein n=1 Tax=Calidithermus chliarophilus TaxID=52023 RepID=UPI000421BBD2|nr:DUF883 family protein [Calidithermus chliarophilus]